MSRGLNTAAIVPKPRLHRYLVEVRERMIELHDVQSGSFTRWQWSRRTSTSARWQLLIE